MNCKDIENPIPIECAMQWTANWQDKYDGVHCSAFLVPVEDLIGALTEMGIIKDGKVVKPDTGVTPMIRSYMAIDPEQTEGFGEKLVLVGTEAAKDPKGNIIYHDIVEGERSDGLVLTNPPTGSGAFDFTQPCPNFCDPDSPLNHN